MQGGTLLPIAASLAAAAAALLVANALSRRKGRRRRREHILEELRSMCSTPLPALHAFQAAVENGMSKGLADSQSGGLMMLPSFVDVLPAGDESGDYYAIDLGGTNLRVLWVRLGKAAGTVEARDLREWPIPDECYDTDNGKLLPWVAACALEVMQDHKQQQSSTANPPVIGFCFSFACRQKALDHGELLLWTKSFRGQGLLNQDVVAALVEAFASRGVTVCIPALMNDTVATLVARRYTDKNTVASIILGTGTNCAYIESTDRIATLPPITTTTAKGKKQKRSYGPTMVINTEWGDMSAESLPRCEEDIWVDCASANPGHGLFEKLVSGLYLGEVTRRLLLRLADEGGLFASARVVNLGASSSRTGAHTVRRALLTPYSLPSSAVSIIDQDDSKNLSAATEALESSIGLQGAKLADVRVAQEVCQLVCKRGARLCAAAVAAVLERCRPDAEAPVVIGVDGSVFSKYPAFRQRMREALVELLGESAAATVSLELTQDGSVEGAAYLAAAAAAAAK